jgi:hypothetical protein
MPMTDIMGFLGCELMMQRVHGVGKDQRRLIQEKRTAGDSTLLIRLPQWHTMKCL